MAKRYKYLGYADFVEYPPGSETMHERNSIIPGITKDEVERMIVLGHQFEGFEPEPPAVLPDPPTVLMPNPIEPPSPPPPAEVVVVRPFSRATAAKAPKQETP